MESFSFSGKKLLGLEYEPLMPFVKDCSSNAFKIIHGDFVTTDDGTGIVHIAPGFGEDDQKICKENGINVFCPVDEGGCFTNEVGKEIEYKLGDKYENLSLKGRQVFETNDDIIKYLKGNDLWLKTEQYLHNYPHCWRTDTPLIYKAVSSWYVAVTGTANDETKTLKEKMIEYNKGINWIPNHIKDGQFGKWLENAHDWSISRNRFWGCPIPIWKSNNPQNKELYVFGSIKELEEFFGIKVKDLHRPFIDTLKKADPYDSRYEITRVEDILDCWFESGSMPFASVHYPFENRRDMNSNLSGALNPPKNFPADFIVEYVAQTRGWFYTLVVLGAALFDSAPFKNCICHGVILDEKSQKLSKRLKNYPDPMEMFDVYGSDAMRWAMMRTPVMRGGELNIDREGKMFEDIVRTILNPIWNAFKFYKTYSEIDKIKIDDNEIESKIENLTDKIDLYIIAKLKELSNSFKKNMDEYDLSGACVEGEKFIDILNNWYIRRNKGRFWSSEMNKGKNDAYLTLYFVLKNMSIILSPLLPHLCEEIYCEL